MTRKRINRARQIKDVTSQNGIKIFSSCAFSIPFLFLLLRADLEAYTDFYGKTKQVTVTKSRSNDNVTDGTEPEETQESLITYSAYETVVDLLASWYLQEYVTPLHMEQEAPFNPLDPTQVDLTVGKKK